MALDCFQCGETFDSDKLSDHCAELHTGRMELESEWSCGECHFAGSSVEMLINHCILDGHDSELATHSLPSRLIQLLHDSMAGKEAPTEPRFKAPRAAKPAAVAQNGQTAEEEGDDEEEPPHTGEVSSLGRVACRGCRTSLQAKKANVFGHVVACLRLRPWHCSACGLLSARRQNIVNHIRLEASCRWSKGAAELVDEEGDKKRFEAGLRALFPHVKLHWTGLLPGVPEQ